MDWIALGAISEVIGTIAIVASLIYVAIQLKQNTSFLRNAASQERVQRDSEISASIIENRDVAEIFLKAKSGFNALDAVDQFRVILFERRAIVHWNNMFELRRQNLLPDADWKELTFLINFVGCQQGLLATWNIFKESFGSEFQSFLDEQLQKAQVSNKDTD